MYLSRKLRNYFHVLCAAAFTLLSVCTTRADELQLIFQAAPGEFVPYLSASANAERGVAYNPAA